jgi:hypothetical protein
MTYHSNSLGAMTGEGLTEPEYSEFRANMLAVNDYFMRTEAVTSEAKHLKNDWVRWYDDLDYYDYYVTCSWLPCKHWDVARVKKKNFEKANATSQEELEWIENVHETGMSSEEMMGQADRRRSDGGYGDTPLKDAKAKSRLQLWLEESMPGVPTGYLIGGAVLLGAGAYVHFAFLRPWSKASGRAAARVGA